MPEVTVTFGAAPGEVFEQVLRLDDGATAAQAVAASRLGSDFPDVQWESMVPGIWGKARTWDYVLAAGDRVELCRPLLVDPKVARRERFRRQGARGTGLFARQRKGGKAGY